MKENMKGKGAMATKTKEPSARALKAEAKRNERLIETTYYANCSGVQIDMMDIGKVFAEGEKALAEGRDLKTAIVAFVETIRKN